MPENATDKTLICESSNPDVASVSDGTITALTAGTATITAYSSDRVISAEAVVTVTAETADEDTSGDDSSQGSSDSSDSTGSSDTTDSSSASSDDTSGSSSSSSGSSDSSSSSSGSSSGSSGSSSGSSGSSSGSSGSSSGSSGGSSNGSGNSTVSEVYVDSITLNKSSLSLKKGESATLTATISPSNATDKTLIWESSNPSVTTVSDGYVKAVATGQATITVYSSDRVVYAQASISVAASVTNDSTGSGSSSGSSGTSSGTTNQKYSDDDIIGILEDHYISIWGDRFHQEKGTF